jgi:hypothetical protein
MKNSKVIVPIILVLVGLGAGFFGGYQYRNYRLNQIRGNFAVGGTSGAQRFTGTRGTGTGGARGGFGGAVNGSILSVDGNSFTVKLADGSSKIVLFSASTTYSNTVSAAQTDLKVGGNVMVMGSTNSDGSVTATSVQINPISFRPQGSPAPSATP